MATIYSSFKDVWLQVKNDKNNLPLVFFCLLIITIPLPFAFNNVALALFLISLIFYKKPFLFNPILFLLIALFILFSISFFWSIDPAKTLKAMPRSLILLLLPIGFMFFGHINDKLRNIVLNAYSTSFFILVVYYLLKAIIRFFIFHNTEVFFYHGSSYEIDEGLVPKALNAIHVSVFASLAYCIELTKTHKKLINYVFLSIFALFIILLSSKNIIIVFGLLNLIYLFYFSTSAYKMRLRNLLVFVGFVGLLISFSKIKERFTIEFADHSAKSVSHHVIHEIPESVNILSIREAWENEKFTPNDFFPGTAFRVYQLRLFLDFLKEDHIFWTGFGYAASQPKIEEKGKYYNVFLGTDQQSGYQTNNFHNQFIQVFAETGVFWSAGFCGS